MSKGIGPDTSVTLQLIELPEMSAEADQEAVLPAATLSTKAVDDALVVGAGELDDDSVVAFAIVEVVDPSGQRGATAGDLAWQVDEQLVGAGLDEVAELVKDGSGEEEASDACGQRDRCEYQSGDGEFAAIAIVVACRLEAEHAEHDRDHRRASCQDEHERHPAQRRAGDSRDHRSNGHTAGSARLMRLRRRLGGHRVDVAPAIHGDIRRPLHTVEVPELVSTLRIGIPARRSGTASHASSAYLPADRRVATVGRGPRI